MRRGIDAVAMSGDGSRALVNAAEAWLATAAECQRGMIAFVAMRLGKDGENAREMLDCGDPADASAIHPHWLKETLRDYGSEMTKLLAPCTDRGRSTICQRDSSIMIQPA